ncbi:MAG: acyl-CoA dehydrogenase family protein [Parasphingopyxis sp.]|nr:acyl-CoA/acyl-ACP dehydrogenase [Sphingomonadales bacterium]
MAALNDEQTMLRDMARDWSNEKSPVSAFRKMRDTGFEQGYDPSVYGEMAQMGWAGIIIPEQYGGSDFGFLSLGLVLEELGRNLNASPLAASSAAAAAIIVGGSDAQKEEYLPKIAGGDLVATLAIDEGPHHDPDAIEAGVSDGKLSGTKTFVPEGDGAGLFVVGAKDGLYLVEGEADGVSRASRSMVDSRSHAEIAFDGAAADRLADGGDELLTDILDRARIIASAEMLGMAVQAFETTLDYLKQRVQFGQALSSFQAIQHRMANMFAEIELMRSSVEGALQAVDSGLGIAQAASLAKATANDTLNLVTREMIQLHGGIGMTDEHDAGFYIKRARILEQQWGNASFHRDRFAKLSGY